MMKFAIIGSPVDHSLSPRLHEAGFRAAGIDAVYHKIAVEPERLAESLDSLRQNGYTGWNVTYPLKEKILDYLDVLTPEALNCGSVNTVKLENGLLCGHNTDGDGFVSSLTSLGYCFDEKNIVILGAGGSARAIAASLSSRNCKISIRNRSCQKAEGLARMVSRLGGQASSDPFEHGLWLRDIDLLIQTTPVGMAGDAYPLSLYGINPAAWVVDIIYKDQFTPFLKSASGYGCKTLNGLGMLIHQAALAWKFWLGVDGPVEIMRDAITRI